MEIKAAKELVEKGMVNEVYATQTLGRGDKPSNKLWYLSLHLDDGKKRWIVEITTARGKWKLYSSLEAVYNDAVRIGIETLKVDVDPIETKGETP